MPTPKKRYPYNFIYEDGNYMTFEITNEEYDQIRTAIREQEPVTVSSGIISTKGLRFVVELKEQPPAPAPALVQDADPVVDREVEEYLRYIRQEG